MNDKVKDSDSLPPEDKHIDNADGVEEKEEKDSSKDLQSQLITNFLQKISKLEKELNEKNDLLTRFKQEYRDYVNRTKKISEDRYLEGKISVIKSQILILDIIDNAIKHNDVKGIFKVVAEELLKLFASLGLEKFGNDGDQFDPKFHEAISSSSTSLNQVIKVIQPGYICHNILIRPAKVEVHDEK